MRLVQRFLVLSHDVVRFAFRAAYTVLDPHRPAAQVADRMASCETRIAVLPARNRSRSASADFCAKPESPTDSTSSINITSGLACHCQGRVAIEWLKASPKWKGFEIAPNSR